MRYINYYDNDTLSIFDKNTNKILANILLDKEDIPTEKEAKEARKYYCENQ